MNKNVFVPLENFMDLLLDAVCVVDADGRFVFVSAACERIFGYTPEEMIGTSMIDMVAPEDRERTLHAAGEIMSGQPKPHFENRYIRKDGHVVHIMWSARWSEADQLRIAVARDITERKRAESMQGALYAISEAAHAAEDLRALFQSIHRIVATLLPAQHFAVALTEGADGDPVFHYHANEADPTAASPGPGLTALSKAVILGRQPMLLTHETLPALSGGLRAALDADTLCCLGVPLNSHKGVIGALILKSDAGGTCYTDSDKELLQFVSTQIATAIERKQMHERLQYTAQYDALTGLPNRSLLFDRLETALARARRKHGRISLLYLDLDKFKQVNDTFGHAAGDQLLRETAHRLRQCVRETDTVARIGGDEFVVLLEDIQSPENAVALMKKMQHVLTPPMTLSGHELRIVPSIGIALYPDHGEDVQTLLKHADEAMYFAKRTRNEPPFDVTGNAGSKAA